MDPILMDECLSPKSAAVAQARGHSAMHASWLDLGSTEDWVIAAAAAERDCVIVANNRRDYLRLYRQLEVHNGLIVIIPSVPRPQKKRLSGLALDVAEKQDSLINLLIDVHADGSVEVRNWARDSASATVPRDRS